MPASVSKRIGRFLLPNADYNTDVVRNVRLAEVANRIRPRNVRNEPVISTLARMAACLQDPETGEPKTLEEIRQANAGTAAAGVTATEFGNESLHVTKLVVNTTLPAIAGGAALAVGKLIYTLPLDFALILGSRMKIAITQTEANIDADTPDFGLGTTIASGVVSVLGGTAAFENIATGVAKTDCDGADDYRVDSPTAGTPLGIFDPASPPTPQGIYFNVADTWAASGDAGALLTGEIWLMWAHLGLR